MAAFSGNNIFLSIDGVDHSAYFTTLNLEPSNEEQDITRGSGTAHRQRASGLDDTSFSATLSYDVTNISTQLPRFRPGIHAVEIGPEGAVAGKPRHVQNFHFDSAPFEISVEKTHVTFQIEGSGSEAPSVDMFAAGVYS